jgi:catechol 2,3-dioxygenase-like lactoylglutathione lyase family enzyme
MKSIEIIMIPVTDQQKAKEFYVKLGFEIAVEAPMEHGQTWIQMKMPDQDVSIALVSFHGVIFESDDIEKDIQELKAKGINSGEIDSKPWGKFSWLKDPDGNGLCLHQK